jgi:L-seryl-tRNA(Ser) seleniumtransferase
MPTGRGIIGRMVPASPQSLLRKLPSVDELLRSPSVMTLVTRDGRAAVTDAARTVLARLREEIVAGQLEGPPAGDRGMNERRVELALAGIEDAVEQQLSRSLQPSLRPVINATGVILHTNLGRAPLSRQALDHVRESAQAYSNLEFDLDLGERGKRDVHVDRLFQHLLGPTNSQENTSAVSTIVVNNNAAAVLLALNTLAENGEVIVSRGELVEIGGSFRIPDVMAKSNAVLREVGTTNRTRIADYERAINDKTRALLRVHRSNFEISGFTEQPLLEELVELSRRRNIPLLEDLGSGALFDLQSIGVSGENGVLDSLRTGVDAVMYSGDKLLGGPQAGMISGSPDIVARMRANSLFRALRVDKLTYAALEATLLAYVKRDYESVPALRMMHLSKDEISRRAEALAKQVATSKLQVTVIDGESVLGGGAAPSAVLPTRLLAVSCGDLSSNELAAQLRAAETPVIVRVEDGRVLIDLRTVFPEQDEVLTRALNRIEAAHRS